jgi:hypothetical protein
VSQDRLHRILRAAAEAARTHPDWQPDDRFAIIIDDGESSALNTRGRFGSTWAVAGLLEYHAELLRKAPQG